MNGFLARFMDGPAAGWEYHASIEPDERIALAPGYGPFKWMRVLVDEPAYPDQVEYIRGRLNRGSRAHGDVEVQYWLDARLGEDA